MSRAHVKQHIDLYYNVVMKRLLFNSFTKFGPFIFQCSPNSLVILSRVMTNNDQPGCAQLCLDRISIHAFLNHRIVMIISLPMVVKCIF